MPVASLQTLLDLGCYVNAGHLDNYDGTHFRLGEVTTAGDVIFVPGADLYIRKLQLKNVEQAFRVDEKSRKEDEAAKDDSQE